MTIRWWIMKMRYMYRVKFYSSMNKNEICRKMGGTGKHIKWGNQTHKDKNCTLFLICEAYHGIIAYIYIYIMVFMQMQVPVPMKTLS